METAQVTQLRNLLVAHDNAVLQIYILEKKVHSLMMKMTKQIAEGHIIHGVKLAQRRCIMEGVKQMYYFYQHRKWKEVQSYIETITSQMEEGYQHPELSQGHQLENGHNPQTILTFREIMMPDWQEYQDPETFMAELEQMVVVEEHADASDTDGALIDSSDTDDEMEEGEEEDVYWSPDNQYVNIIIRGLCLESCELHRSD